MSNWLKSFSRMFEDTYIVKIREHKNGSWYYEVQFIPKTSWDRLKYKNYSIIHQEFNFRSEDGAKKSSIKYLKEQKGITINGES